MIESHGVRARALVLALLTCLACGHADRAQAAATHERTCSNGTSLMLSDSGIGALRLGASVDAIREQCVVFRDTVELSAVGMKQRVLHTQLGPAMMYVEIVNSRVSRISTTSPVLLTEDGLGAGSSLESLLQTPNIVGTLVNNSVVVRMPNHCGLSFQLDSNATRSVKLSSTVYERALRKLPLSTKVERVHIVGCTMKH